MCFFYFCCVVFGFLFCFLVPLPGQFLDCVLVHNRHFSSSGDDTKFKKAIEELLESEVDAIDEAISSRSSIMSVLGPSIDS